MHDAKLPLVGRFDVASRARADAVGRGGGRHGAACTSSTSTRARPSPGTRWRPSDWWPAPPSEAAPSRPAPRPSGATCGSAARPAQPGCSCCPALIVRRLLRVSRPARHLPQLHQVQPADPARAQRARQLHPHGPGPGVLERPLVTFKYVIINIGFQTVLALASRC